MVLACCSLAVVAPEADAFEKTGSKQAREATTRLPAGSWSFNFSVDNKRNATTTAKGTLTIQPNGLAFSTVTTEHKLYSGLTVTVGKFRGVNRIVYTTSAPAKVKRVGDELYALPAGKEKLVSGNPPGYTLWDYETLGGVLPELAKKDISDEGASIYRIAGRDLVLMNSYDGKKYLLKRR